VNKQFSEQERERGEGGRGQGREDWGEREEWRRREGEECDGIGITAPQLQVCFPLELNK